MSGWQITVEDCGKPELLEWARDHGMDPERVSMNHGHLPEIWDGQICYGDVVIDPETGRDLVDEIHSVPVIKVRNAPVTRPLPPGVGRQISQSEQVTWHRCATCESHGPGDAA